MAPSRHFSAASLPPAAAPSCFWSSTSPQDGPCGDHMPLRAVLSSPQKQAMAHSTGVAELGQTQSRAGKGERDPHPLPGPSSISSAAVSLRWLCEWEGGHGPIPSRLPLSSATAVPCPQEPQLVAVLPAIGPAAASEEQCAPTVWYQIVHQNYYFQHLWLNCKTIIQMTLGVCWS